MLPGFEPTTFGTWVSSHNYQTRAPGFRECPIFNNKKTMNAANWKTNYLIRKWLIAFASIEWTRKQTNERTTKRWHSLNFYPIFFIISILLQKRLSCFQDADDDADEDADDEQDNLHRGWRPQLRQYFLRHPWLLFSFIPVFSIDLKFYSKGAVVLSKLVDRSRPWFGSSFDVRY